MPLIRIIALVEMYGRVHRSKWFEGWLRIGSYKTELDIDGLVDDNIELLDDTEWENLLEEYPEYENEI